MIGWLAGMYTSSDKRRSSVCQSMHCATCFTDLQVTKSSMMFEHIYGVASFIVMLVALFCVFIMHLALTAICRVHWAFLLESATREEQERVNRGQREFQADRRSNAEEGRPRRFARRRLPVQHDERQYLGVSIRFVNSFFFFVFFGFTIFPWFHAAIFRCRSRVTWPFCMHRERRRWFFNLSKSLFDGLKWVCVVSFLLIGTKLIYWANFPRINV